MHYMIIDIDNCLVNSKALEKFIPVKKDDRAGWDTYHKNMHLTYPNTFIVSLVSQYLRRGLHPIFLTAREATDTVKHRTEKLIHKTFSGCEGYEGYSLIMRDVDDFRPDVLVKSDKLTEILKAVGKESIVFAIDDNPSICQMYRIRGLETLNYIQEPAKRY